jgi:hypothetical protein
MQSAVSSAFAMGVEPYSAIPKRENHMSNAVVLITGALTGSGRDTALAFA